MSKMNEEKIVWYDEPVSPNAQYFNSSALNVSIISVFELEIPFDDSQTMSALENLFLPISPRFSCIVVRDEHGNKRWKRVKVKLEDHVNIPIFPPGIEFYDDVLQEYLSKISVEEFPEDRPLWEVHIIKYPTSNAAGIVVFKLHHALGDGFSLMSALFSCLKRADNPSLPLTFPSRREKDNRNKSKLCSSTTRFFSMFVNTIHDFSLSFLKSNKVEDSISPIRSGIPGVELEPISLSSVTFSLSDIKQIKSNMKGTVNDVMTGIIFYGIQLYIQAMGQSTKANRITALVFLNTRAINSYQYQSLDNKSTSWWGNKFAFLHTSIPRCTDVEKINPLDFVYKAKQIIKAKRNSLGFYLTGMLINLVRKLKGIEAASRYVLKTLTNSSTTISNMIGPLEQVQIIGHPVKSFYFMMVRAPQSLNIAIVSYMGKVRVAFGAEKSYINSEILNSCMDKSFERIFEAAVGKGYVTQKGQLKSAAGLA